MKRFFKSSCARSKQAPAKGGSKKEEEENKTDNRARERGRRRELFLHFLRRARGCFGWKVLFPGVEVFVFVCVCVPLEYCGS